MPEQRIFGLDIPSPNVALNTLRIAIVDAIAELKNGGANTDDLFLLMDMVLSLTDTALTDVATAVEEREQLRTDITALTVRVEALEPQPEPPADPAVEEPPADQPAV